LPVRGKTNFLAFLPQNNTHIVVAF